MSSKRRLALPGPDPRPGPGPPGARRRRTGKLEPPTVEWFPTEERQWVAAFERWLEHLARWRGDGSARGESERRGLEATLDALSGRIGGFSDPGELFERAKAEDPGCTVMEQYAIACTATFREQLSRWRALKAEYD